MKKRTAIAYLILLSLCAGCATLVSAFLQGGRTVPHDYAPAKILVSYRMEGTVPAGVQYHLVETASGLAIFEQNEKGMHALMETRWESQRGDHFAAWVHNGPAFEFVIPKDRTQNAERFAYNLWTYTVKIVDGVKRPVPKEPKSRPDTVLIPK